MAELPQRGRFIVAQVPLTFERREGPPVFFDPGAGPVEMPLTDVYQEYADEHGISRDEAKSRMFKVLYGGRVDAPGAYHSRLPDPEGPMAGIVIPHETPEEE